MQKVETSNWSLSSHGVTRDGLDNFLYFAERGDRECLFSVTQCQVWALRERRGDGPLLAERRDHSNNRYSPGACLTVHTVPVIHWQVSKGSIESSKKKCGKFHLWRGGLESFSHFFSTLNTSLNEVKAIDLKNIGLKKKVDRFFYMGYAPFPSLSSK